MRGSLVICCCYASRGQSNEEYSPIRRERQAEHSKSTVKQPVLKGNAAAIMLSDARFPEIFKIRESEGAAANAQAAAVKGQVWGKMFDVQGPE